MGLRWWFLLPARLWLAALILAPLAIVFYSSLLTRGAYGGQDLPLTLDSYVRLADPLYLTIYVRSVGMAIATTGLCFVLGFPVAWLISRAGRWRSWLLHMVLVPFYASFLIRLYAWVFLLRDTGLINSALQWIGLVREPLPLLHNSFAVLVGLVYGYLPFMILPVYAALDRQDPALEEAAADLGAGPWPVLFRVTIPLAKAGIRAGSVLVFIPSLGAYLVPDLLGGGKSILIGNLVQNQFTASRDWPFGAALSMVLMAAVLAAIMFRKEEMV